MLQNEDLFAKSVPIKPRTSPAKFVARALLFTTTTPRFLFYRPVSSNVWYTCLVNHCWPKLAAELLCRVWTGTSYMEKPSALHLDADLGVEEIPRNTFGIFFLVLLHFPPKKIGQNN